MQQTDYSSENFYQSQAIRKALACLLETLENGFAIFHFDSFEADPKAYYLKYGPNPDPNASPDVVLGFDKLFFYDSCPVAVRYGVQKYAIINPDFSIEYPENFKGPALDLAYILRSENAFGMYAEAMSGLYYNKLDIVDLLESLKFKKQNKQLDLIRDLPEHEALISPVFPESAAAEFIKSVNKMLSDSCKLDCEEAVKAIKDYWIRQANYEKWSPWTELEAKLAEGVVKIMSTDGKTTVFLAKNSL